MFKKATASGNNGNCVEVDLEFRKSSASSVGNCVEVAMFEKSSASNNGHCVEVDREYKKSSASSSGNCVEVDMTEMEVAVRNSKSPNAGTVYFTGDEWRAFITGVHNGEFELPEGQLALAVARRGNEEENGDDGEAKFNSALS